MPKCCINFLASATLTVLTPVPHIALCERQIPSCVSLSKPIAQHFRYLSSAEKDLSTADIHRCGLIVCCATNHMCVSGGFGFAVPLCRASPRAGFGMCSGAAVALLCSGGVSSAQEGTGLHSSSQAGCSGDASNQPSLAGVP